MNKYTRSRGHDLKAINWVRDKVRGLRPYERMLLQYLATRCNNDGTHTCYPEQRQIATDLEIDRRTVIRYLKTLEEKSLISIRRRPNKSCVYTMHVSGSDSQMSLPEVTQDDTPGSDFLMHHKEKNIEGKESEVERKVDRIDFGRGNPSGSPAKKENAIATKENREEENKNENIGFLSEEKNSCAPADYIFSEFDYTAARALVWFDLYGSKADGCRLVKRKRIGLWEEDENSPTVPLDSETMALVEASKLASEYAVNIGKGSPKSRVAFWHQCGRIFYPKLRRFAVGHKLPNSQSKTLHQICDDLAISAPYVIAYWMANWSDLLPDIKRAPDLQDLESFGCDAMYEEWFERGLNLVKLPDTRAKDFVRERFGHAYQKIICRRNDDPLIARPVLKGMWVD